LKALTFDQPTAWLATQLERDPDLWNRQWVIGELAKRTGDAAAAAAIAKAVTGADYPFTRALAASAIAEFSPDVALPVLSKALRDTSAEVRTAAAATLGNVGGAVATELARTAWRGDA